YYSLPSDNPAASLLAANLAGAVPGGFTDDLGIAMRSVALSLLVFAANIGSSAGPGGVGWSGMSYSVPRWGWAALPHVVIADTALTSKIIGGAQSFLIDLSAGLVRAGWRVTVLTQRGENPTVVTALEGSGAEVWPEQWDAWHLPDERAAAIVRRVKSTDMVVYVISVSPDAAWLALPHLDPSVATMAIAHNDVEAFYAPITYYGRFLDRAVGVSSRIASAFVSECLIPPDRVAMIPYGVASLVPAEVDRKVDRRSPDLPIRIGYVGRLEQEQKRIMDLVPIFRRLNDRRVAFSLDIVGDGSQRGHLERELRVAGVSDTVRFWGW